jgi:hypothetical protein
LSEVEKRKQGTSGFGSEHERVRVRVMTRDGCKRFVFFLVFFLFFFLPWRGVLFFLKQQRKESLFWATQLLLLDTLLDETHARSVFFLTF